MSAKIVVLEVWKHIPQYRCQVSNLGNVKGPSGKVLKPGRSSTGRLSVVLGGKSVTVHSLVALAYIGPKPDGYVICHNDGNPLNNNADNLRYGTYTDNQYDRVKHGTHSSSVKTHCPSGHPYSGGNLRISPNGVDKHGNPKFKRRCRECANIQNRKKREVL